MKKLFTYFLVLIIFLFSNTVGAVSPVFYSICPYGAGSSYDLQENGGGTLTISISGGVATLSVAQDENIGVGCDIDYGTGPTNVYIAPNRVGFDSGGTSITTDTTDGTTSYRLVDSGATFITSGVEPGDFVENTTDTTYTQVLAVESETQLRLTDDIFVSGEGYTIARGILPATEIEENAGDASGIVRAIEITSGEWTDGDAAGYVYFESTSGTWTNNTQIDLSKPSSTSNVSTVDGTLQGNLGNGNTQFVVKDADGSDASNDSGNVNYIYHEYSSLSGFEGGFTDSSHINNADLTSASVVAHGCCYYDHDDQTEATSVNFDWNGTTDETCYLQVFTPVGNSESINNQRHAGVWNNNRFYVEHSTTASYEYCIRMSSEDYLRVEGLQLLLNYGHTYSFVVEATGGTASDNRRVINSCIIKGNASTTSLTETYGYRISSNSISDFFNNIIYDIIDTNSANGVGIQVAGASDSNNQKYYNNTIYNCYNGIQDSAYHGGIVINNISYNNANTDFTGTFDNSPACDYNFSEDDTAPGGNSIHGITDGMSPDFVNTGSGTEDFHLQSSSDAIDAGMGVLSDQYLILWRDFEQEERGATFDIGADEYIAVAGGLDIPIAIYHYMHH